MSDADHLSILEQGVEAWNAWRRANPEVQPDLSRADLRGFWVYLRKANLRGAKLTGAHFRRAHLTRANLTDAALPHADLQDANLTDADLTRADLKNANLRDANLKDANLRDADLTEARLFKADFKDANLKDADLTRADLKNANLMGANLKGADLRETDLALARLGGADLRHAKVDSFEDLDLRGVDLLWLNGQSIRGARFSPNAQDPWSVLRRNYTGPRLLFHLLLLVVFVLPYFARILMWAGVNQAQAAIVQNTAKLQAVSDALQDRGDPNALALAQVTEQLSQVQPCLAEDCTRYYVWQLLLGVDQGPWFWLLALALIVYNVFRALLTWLVGPLRDEEERTQHAPELKSYQWLYYVHRASSVLLLVAGAAFVFNLYKWLSMTVALPGP